MLPTARLPPTQMPDSRTLTTGLSQAIRHPVYMTMQLPVSAVSDGRKLIFMS